MSNWTHVCGLIRIDSDFIDYDMTIKNTDKMIKQEITKNLKKNLPKGSEGPLKYRIIKTNTDPNSVVWGFVSVFGDLRDFENPYKIKTWIENFNKNLNFNICNVRDLCIKVYDAQKELVIILSTVNQAETERLQPEIITIIKKY